MMMVRRGLVLLVLVVAIGLAIGLATAEVTAPGATRTTRVPTVVVPGERAGASSCYVAGRTCSIHPCLEFIASRPPRLLPRARLPQPRVPICDRYPRGIPEPVPAGR